MTNTKRPLRVFLCHASGDKPVVGILHERLVRDGIDAWLDKEKLLPGQNWQMEIRKAVASSDVVIVCLSSQSITKDGFVQKEIRIALDIADEKPDGTIFIIPAKLEACDVPERIKAFHWVDLFVEGGYERLLKALQVRANDVGAIIKHKKNSSKSKQSSNKVSVDLDKSSEGQETWNYLFTLKCSDGAIRVVFSPDGQLIANCNRLDSQVQLWSTKTGELIAKLYNDGGDVNDIAFSADGEYLWAGCEDKKIRLWSVAHKKIIDILEGHTDEVWRVASSKDGRRFASAGMDGKILLWKTYNSVLIGEIQPKAKARSLSFYPYNSMAQYLLVSIDINGCVQQWGTEDKKLMDTLDSQSYGEVFDMTISADDRFLAFSAYGEVYLWDLFRKEYYGSIMQSPTFIWSVAFDPNKFSIALGHENGTVQLYNPLNKTTQNILRGHTRRVRSVTYSIDGQFLATGSEDKTIRVWKRNG